MGCAPHWRVGRATVLQRGLPQDGKQQRCPPQSPPAMSYASSGLPTCQHAGGSSHLVRHSSHGTKATTKQWLTCARPHTLLLWRQQHGNPKPHSGGSEPRAAGGPGTKQCPAMWKGMQGVLPSSKHPRYYLPGPGRAPEKPTRPLGTCPAWTLSLDRST